MSPTAPPSLDAGHPADPAASQPSSTPPVAFLLTVGDELLAGDIVDGNKARLAASARAWGLEVRRAVSVRDRIDEIVAALREAAAQAHVCLVSGGLGPTTDDLTTAAVAQAAGRPLRRDPDAVARLEEKFRRYGVANMPPANLKQADFPEGAEILPNPIGSAEGLRCEMPGPKAFGARQGDDHEGPPERVCQVFVMPGVPHELERMLAEQVAPRVRERFSLRPVPRRVYRMIGLGESAVAAKVEPLVDAARERSPGLAAVYVHYRAHMPQVTVALEATPGPLTPQGVAQATVEELASLDAAMIEALTPAIYGIGETELPARIVAALTAAGLTFATAESCTGGGLGALITSIAGSSACFRGGIVSYDNDVKQRLLGVPADMLAAHGAVSEPVARAMALGARRQLQSDLAAGITGIAGPGGGSPEKPVGTVHIAIADGEETFHKALSLRGSRGIVQAASALWALKLLWDRLRDRGLVSVTAGDP